MELKADLVSSYLANDPLYWSLRSYSPLIYDRHLHWKFRYKGSILTDLVSINVIHPWVRLVYCYSANQR
jgi:hypothetical protein